MLPPRLSKAQIPGRAYHIEEGQDTASWRTTKAYAIHSTWDTSLLTSSSYIMSLESNTLIAEWPFHARGRGTC